MLVDRALQSDKVTVEIQGVSTYLNILLFGEEKKSCKLLRKIRTYTTTSPSLDFLSHILILTFVFLSSSFFFSA